MWCNNEPLRSNCPSNSAILPKSSLLKSMAVIARLAGWTLPPKTALWTLCPVF